MRPAGQWVHSGSLGSLGCAQVVLGFIRGHRVPAGAPWKLSAGSLDSHGCAAGVVGVIQGRWVDAVRPEGRGVHSGSLGSRRVHSWSLC